MSLNGMTGERLLAGQWRGRCRPRWCHCTVLETRRALQQLLQGQQGVAVVLVERTTGVCSSTVSAKV
jgi:hypothetical protein